MNKEEITKTLNEYVKPINEKFKVTDDDDLTLYYDDLFVAYFLDWEKNEFRICQYTISEKTKLIAETGIINKFYTKAVELLDKMDETNNNENIHHRNLLVIRALEDIVLGNLKVDDYRECAGVITLKLEKASEER